MFRQISKNTLCEYVFSPKENNVSQLKTKDDYRKAANLSAFPKAVSSVDLANQIHVLVEITKQALDNVPAIQYAIQKDFESNKQIVNVAIFKAILMAQNIHNAYWDPMRHQLSRADLIMLSVAARNLDELMQTQVLAWISNFNNPVLRAQVTMAAQMTHQMLVTIDDNLIGRPKRSPGELD